MTKDVLLIAEGDSWFNHQLLGGIPYYLGGMDDRYYKELLAWPGDDMIRYIQRRDYLNELRSWEGNGIIKHRFLLLSGGGNDMMETHFDEYLKPTAPYLNETYKKKVAQILATYDLVFQLVQQKHPNVHVLTHGYAVPFPRANGSHLGKKMRAIGITDLDGVGHKIMTDIITNFNKQLKAMAANYDKVHFIDLRSLAKNKGDWNDEIHPKKSVFKTMAIEFHKVIQGVLAG